MPLADGKTMVLLERSRTELVPACFKSQLHKDWMGGASHPRNVSWVVTINLILTKQRIMGRHYSK